MDSLTPAELEQLRQRRYVIVAVQLVLVRGFILKKYIQK